MSADLSDRERSVRFHGRVQFKTIRHVADFSDDEILEGWYRKKDFLRMSEEVSEIAQLVSQGNETHNGEELSIRGLEHLVEEDVADYRAEKMIASIDAVLDEQDEQRDEDVNDPDIIAKLYAEIVTPLQREAYLVGLRDAKEAITAAEQIADLPPPKPVKKKLTASSSESDKDKSRGKKGSQTKSTKKKVTSKKKTEKVKMLGSQAEEGEQLLNSGEDKEADVSKSKHISPAERKAAAEKRRNRIRTGVGSELSPLVRRRDGSFAFRNKDLDLAKAEMKRQRKDAVRDSLFKFLDSPDF